MEEREFICDAMLGGLARWLRAAGYSASFNAHIADGELVRRAHEEQRCLLTSDSGIMDRYAVSEGIVESVFIPLGMTVVEQLAHVMGQLGLDLQDSRCMCCDGVLVETTVDAVESEIPPKVLRSRQRFFRCAGCDRVYWRGRHWESIGKRLAAAQQMARRSGRPHN
jgi:uncharacterized protein with PIN domain